MARNLRFAHLASNGHISFFTGTAFAEYDPTKRMSVAITPEHNLPKVLQVRWSSDGALFQTDTPTGNDELYPLSHTATWWVANFRTAKFSPLDGASDAVWDSSDKDTLYYLTSNRLMQGRLGSTTATELTKLERGGLVAADRGSVTATNNNQLVKVQGGKINRLGGWSTQDAIAAVTPDGRFLIASETKPKAKKKTLLTISLDDGKTLSRDDVSLATLVSANNREYVAAGVDGEAFAGVIHSFGDGLSQPILIALQHPNRFDKPTNYVQLGNGNFLAANDAGDSAILTRNQSEAQSIKNYPPILFDKNTITISYGYFTYDFLSNRIDVFDTFAGSVEQKRAITLAEVQKLGVDPHQLIKLWHEVDLD